MEFRKEVTLVPAVPVCGRCVGCIGYLLYGGWVVSCNVPSAIESRQSLPSILAVNTTSLSNRVPSLTKYFDPHSKLPQNQSTTVTTVLESNTKHHTTRVPQHQLQYYSACGWNTAPVIGVTMLQIVLSTTTNYNHHHHNLHHNHASNRD